jgi:bifunctional non-homologous end joining protein LigD
LLEISLESGPFVLWSCGVVFQRKKPAAIGAKAPFPGFIEPALATSVERVPGGERWVHEIKFGGYRAPVISETPQSRLEPL